MAMVRASPRGEATEGEGGGSAACAGSAATIRARALRATKALELDGKYQRWYKTVQYKYLVDVLSSTVKF